MIDHVGAELARLEDAEFELTFDIPNWATHVLERFSGNLVNIGPLLLPTRVAYTAYSVLWNEMGHRPATELLREKARLVLGTRGLDRYTGKCPACGKQGEVTCYDYGDYYVTKHHNEIPGSFLGHKTPNLPRHCYHGPHPVPQTYKG